MTVIQQIIGQDTGFSSILQYILSITAFLLIWILVGNRLQMIIWIWDIKKALRALTEMSTKATSQVVERISKVAGNNFEVSNKVNMFLDFFAIYPVDLDPNGIVRKLEHLLNTERKRIREFILSLVPTASKQDIDNFENLLAIAQVLNIIYKYVRHNFILGEKTKSPYILMQLEMIIPLIMRYARAYYNALTSFINLQPIGDGIGALVAAKLMYGQKYEKIAEDTVTAEIFFEGRRLIVVKAEGPSGVVGKPGEAISKIIEMRSGNIDGIVMVDAAMKLEGEEVGSIAEGVGAAIGDPGPEKYKIEEEATKHKIPIYALVVKESLEDAITTMKKEIFDAADKIIEKIRAIVTSYPKGATLIIAGIGNTMGIGQ
ncbi:MAG: DUF1512 domain-containing protein [Candidatus Methanomethylicia archaeon]